MNGHLMNDGNCNRSRNHNNNNNNHNHNKLNMAAAAAVALNRKIVFEIYTQSQEGALRSTTNNTSQMPLTAMKMPPNHAANNNHDAPAPALLRHSSAPKRKELKLTIIPIPSSVVTTATAAASLSLASTSTPSSPTTTSTMTMTTTPSNIAMRPIAFIRNLFVSLRPSKSRPGFYSPTRDLPPIGKIALQLSTSVNIDDNDGGGGGGGGIDENDDDDDDNGIVAHAKHHEQLSSDEGDGSISNTSLKHVDQNALEDELSTYMQEIREREKR